MWMLSDEAILNGVEPTTRFRNNQRPPLRAKALRNPYPSRHMNGVSGNQAARRSARLRGPAFRSWQSQSPTNGVSGACSRQSTPFENRNAPSPASLPEDYMSSIGLGISFDNTGTTEWDGMTNGCHDFSWGFMPHNSGVNGHLGNHDCQQNVSSYKQAQTVTCDAAQNTSLGVAEGSTDGWMQACSSQGQPVPHTSTLSPIKPEDDIEIQPDTKGQIVFESNSQSPANAVEGKGNEEWALQFGNEFFTIESNDPQRVQDQLDDIKTQN